MFGWLRRTVRKVEIYGVGVEFHPPQPATPEAAPSTPPGKALAADEATASTSAVPTAGVNDKVERAREHVARGREYWLIHDFDRAVSEATEALTLVGDSAEAYRLRADALIQLRRLEAALFDAEMLLIHQPDKVRNLSLMLVILVCLGKKKRAQKVREAILQHPRAKEVGVAAAELEELLAESKRHGS